MKIRVVSTEKPYENRIENAETGEIIEGITSAKLELFPNRPTEAHLVFKTKDSVFDIVAKRDNLSASEALYAFCAWLTSRKEVVTLSDNHDAGAIVELIAVFCKVNDLTEPHDGWN